MKTAKEILDIAANEKMIEWDINKFSNSHVLLYKSIIKAINNSRKEAIEECAKREDEMSDYRGNTYISRKSILSLINELK